MKYLRIITSSAVISLLAACSSNPAVSELGKPPVPAKNTKLLEKTPQDIKNHDIVASEKLATSGETPTKTTTSPDAPNDTPTPEQNNSQATSQIILTQNNNQLVAKATTQWNTSKQGDLYIKWVAPKGTTCHSTQLTITKYKAKNDISTAKRPITSLYTDKTCDGIWAAQVVNKKGVVLTSATTDVEIITAP